MANIPVAPLPFPPDTYDRRYFNELIRTLNLYFRTISRPGPINATNINLSNLSTSSTGLKVGEVWLDTTDNTLKIVMSTSHQVNLVGAAATTSAGTMTV